MDFAFKIYLMIVSLALMTSCDNGDKEPETVPLTVHREFKTESMQVKLSEVSDIADYRDKMYIVNSIDDLPHDMHFGTDELSKADINFSEYSLVLVYQLVLGDIVSYKYYWRYNNWFERYQLNVSLDKVKNSEYVDGKIENCTYFRSAILVKRIPSESIWSVMLDIQDVEKK